MCSFFENDKTWKRFLVRRSWGSPISEFFSVVGSPFSIDDDFQHLFSFAKNFHMSVDKKKKVSCFFDVAKVPTCSPHQVFSLSLWECFIGILQSLFKKVQLEFHVSGKTLGSRLDYFSKWLPQRREERNALCTARNSSYFVCSSLKFRFENFFEKYFSTYDSETWLRESSFLVWWTFYLNFTQSSHDSCPRAASS